MADVLPRINVTDSHGDANPSTPLTSPARPQNSSTVKPSRPPISTIDMADPAALSKEQTHNSSTPRGNSNERPPTSASLDPLSEQIIKRTQTSGSTPQRNSRQIDGDGGFGRFPADTTPDGTPTPGREKRKGSSFLSRFIPNKKKDTAEEQGDDTSDRADERPEGANAELFYQSLDNIAFAPRHPPPPEYVKVRSMWKKEKDFNKLFLAQELSDTADLKPRRKDTNGSTSRRRRDTDEGDAIWAMEFSKDGKYLATAGQDNVLRVWSTLSSREERRMHEKEEESPEGGGEAHRLNAPVFRKTPLRRYEAHTGAILDLSWSKNNFLLSSSMDKTVRLWHITRNECLCAFKHSDFVTSIQFHPRDDRFFLAGSLDFKLRLWSIPDKSVAYWNQVPEMITAVAFTPDGKSAMAGTLSGLCMFYETEGLKYQSQLHVKSTHGKNAKGSKITGIQAFTKPHASSASVKDSTTTDDSTKLLITSNDSRVRLYSLRDKTLEMKFKGNVNTASQIHARFSDDGQRIICGSEDKRVFIWSAASADGGPAPGVADQRSRRARHPFEVFEAHTAITTVAVLAPMRTRQALSASEDPIYDLCNPPPVTLVAKGEEGPNGALGSSGQVTPREEAPPPPLPTTGSTAGSFRRADESPAYVARTAHRGGNIIVTADALGIIKVFRQDCAAEKRRNDFWESSSLFSKRLGAAGMLRRQSSMASGRSRRSSNATQPAGERILSWRQSISHGIGAAGNSGGNGSGRSSPVRGLMQRSNSVKSGSGHGNGNANGSGNGASGTGSRFSLRHHNSSGSKITMKKFKPSHPDNDELAATEARKREREREESGGGNTPIAHDETLQVPGAAHQGQKDAPGKGEELSRASSYTYWRETAWRDSIKDQLSHPRVEYGESSSPSGSMNRLSMTTTGGKGVSASQRSSMLRPTLKKSLSAVSALTSEMSSLDDGEGEGGESAGASVNTASSASLA